MSRSPALPALALLPLLSCNEPGAWSGAVECTFHDGTDHVEYIDTLVCVEGGGDDCGTEPWSAEYGAWTVTVTLVDSGYEGQSISVAVQPTGLDGGTTVLYQLDGAPENEFVGGHGFTGLHYVRHPDVDDTFQWFCAVP